MEAGSSGLRRGVVQAAWLAVFFLVFFFSDWLLYGASLPLFRLAPSTIPENFRLVVRAQRPDSGVEYYRAVSWENYAHAKSETGARTFRLPQADGTIPGSKATYSFRVLEDDGTRQVVEVKLDSRHKSLSRYEAYDDRAVPVAFRSATWGRENSYLTVFFMVVAIAALVAWGVALGVRRLMRLQRT